MEEGADGVTVEGLLYYPLDYKEGHALSSRGADARRPSSIG